ncbi:hypothetical protein R1flu_001605 [Riccia fluitans]|uniref:Uncharacterized protein n=1 Tax=Riccia fluitans TaxID=41844 RepID=A0ABD1Y3X6_9MARC
MFMGSWIPRLSESKKRWSSWCGDKITIENDHSQRPFTVESSGYGSILLRDISGEGLVFLQQQLFAVKRTWKVYIGEKRDKNSCLYTFKRLGRKSFGVFLASSNRKGNPDFIVQKERIHDRNFDVYYKDTEKKSIVEAKQAKGEKKLKVTIQAGVDLAFVATLIVLMDR